MSKFLNDTGLSYFWGKIKTFLTEKYVAKNETITITDDDSNQAIHSSTGFDVQNADIATSVKATGMEISASDGSTTIGDKTLKLSNTETKESVSVSENLISVVGANSTTTINPSSVTASKLVKTGGTNVQVLLADGSIATLNAANGIPKLDSNGRIPLSQLGNLDTTLFQVVTALPTTGIKKNRIYLLKSSSTATQNLYSEYVYTGDVSATYDASKWEKLGEYKADIDLSPYSKKTETLNGMSAGTSTSTNAVLRYTKADSTSGSVNIPQATQSAAGVMTGADKKALDTLTARYPLGISSFTASPSLVQVGASADVTFTWALSNTDFHPVTSQSIVVDEAAAATVAVGTKSYKKTALAGATTATTKTASITINGSLKKDVTVTYHYPSYIGVVANGSTVDATAVAALTKSVEWGKSKTATLTQTNQKIVYAYPASYGDLTSIKDGNGFQGFAGYTKQTMTINGQSYTVYVQNIAATSSSTYTFA